MIVSVGKGCIREEDRGDERRGFVSAVTHSGQTRIRPRDASRSGRVQIAYQIFAATLAFTHSIYSHPRLPTWPGQLVPRPPKTRTSPTTLPRPSARMPKSASAHP